MAGIVHFSNFFRYMEKCEHALARQLDPTGTHFSPESESLWPRVHASCDFHSPARFGDILIIRQFVTRIGDRSITYRFEIQEKAHLCMVATGQLVLAHAKKVHGVLQPQPLPDAIRSLLEPLRIDH
nr:thioesterase family protein [Haloferula luteola]